MKRNSLFLTVCGALATSVALAQTSNPLTLTLSQALVQEIKVDGKTTEKLTPDPKNVTPGNVLNQVVTARNMGSRALNNVVVRLAVPQNTFYLKPETGLSDARVEYSIDGGKTYAAAPLKKMVTVTENGKSVQKEVEVKPSEYTNVRWTLPQIQAGASLKVGFRVQVR